MHGLRFRVEHGDRSSFFAPGIAGFPVFNECQDFVQRMGSDADHHHPGGIIPGVVEHRQVFRGHVPDVLRGAQDVGVEGIDVIQAVHGFLQQPGLGVLVIHVVFRKDDSLFLFHTGFGDVQRLDKIQQQPQRRQRVSRGGKVIGGFLKSSIGIGAGLHGGHVIRHIPAIEPEHLVFQEMGRTGTEAPAPFGSVSLQVQTAGAESRQKQGPGKPGFADQHHAGAVGQCFLNPVHRLLLPARWM